MSKVYLRVGLEPEDRDTVKEWCEANGVSVSEFGRYAIKNAMESKGIDSVVPAEETQSSRIRKIHEEAKPIMVRNELCEDVWGELVNALDMNLPPDPEDFSEQVERYNEIAGELGERDNVRPFVNWVSLIYRNLHPSRGPDEMQIADAFYFVEKGLIPGGTETCELLYDLLDRKGNIPERHIVDAWRKAGRWKRSDAWRDEWREQVGDVLHPEHNKGF